MLSGSIPLPPGLSEISTDMETACDLVRLSGAGEGFPARGERLSTRISNGALGGLILAALSAAVVTIVLIPSSKARSAKAKVPSRVAVVVPDGLPLIVTVTLDSGSADPFALILFSVMMMASASAVLSNPDNERTGTSISASTTKPALTICSFPEVSRAYIVRRCSPSVSFSGV